MLYVLVPLHVVICIFLILVVLLQQGKGADLSVFGGGSTQTAFGARGATTLLHKLTVTSFVLFIATTMLIGIFQGETGGSLLRGETFDTEATAPVEPMEPGESEELLESPSDAAPVEPTEGTAGLGDAPAESAESGAADGGDTSPPPQ